LRLSSRRAKANLAQYSNTFISNSHHPQPSQCAEAALSLLECMEKTECVVKDHKSVLECMKDPVESEDCKAQRNAYYACKHSQLNMRTRIRGVRVY